MKNENNPYMLNIDPNILNKQNENPELEKLKDKDIEVHLVSGSMWFAKISSYNDISITIVRENGEEMNIPYGEIKKIVTKD